VLTVHTPDVVRRALVSEDLATLCLVPGIGRKGAQRMVLELKDKAGLPGAAVVPASCTRPGWRDTLAQALVGLGWTAAQSDQVVDGLAASHPDATDEDVPVLLRAALAQLGRSR
jgi:Holliday junction DNA helicase RuvA